MKKTLLLKTLLLLCAIIVGSNSVKAQDKTLTETFEKKTAAQAYQGTVEISSDESSCGLTWEIYYGCVSENDKITGDNSAQMRYYTGSSSNLGYICNTTAIDNLKKVEFKARVSDTNMKMDVYSSSDGDNWEEVETACTFEAKNTAYDFEFDIPANHKYVLISINNSSSPANKSKLIVDDITFTYEEANKTATTTTIDDADLTNTDVYVGTAAGALSAAVTVTEGGAAVAGATVSWDSSDKNVATIDENGAVTLIAVGTTTITATYNGNDTYGSSKDTYELTVTSSQPKQPYYLVTDASQLADGDKIIIVSDDEALSTEQKTSNRSATGITKEADGSILLDIDTDVQVLTLEKTTVTKENVTSDAWYLQTTGDNYLYASSNSSNQLKTAKKSTVGDNGKAAFSFSGDNALIAFQGSNGRNELRYNYNNGTPIFNCYASSSTTGDAVQIYKATATIAINEACKEGEKYYATYSSTKPFVVPNDITVSSVAVDGEGNLVITDFTQGETVPANYGVLVSAATAGEKKVYYSNDAGTSHADQMLYASSEGLTAAEMATAAPNCEYYRLTMHNETIIGFWWGAENGASFAIAANKAYLAVPKGATAKAGFAFNENVANGINTLDNLTNSQLDNNAPMYNLAGQRVNKSYKGVVIVNGKKMLNK